MLNHHNFLESLKATTLSQRRYKRYVISFSGGLDSMVLVHLMQSLKQLLLADGINISAIYVNHNLSPFASDWGAFCQSICLQYKIPFQSLSVNAKPKPRQSPEEAARDARYCALKEQLNAADCLLTAHHKSDQAETVLLQLLRGTGPKGLAAMPFSRDFFHFTIIRPLLSFSRRQIKDYALKYKLQWVEDESNDEQNYKRNFLRHNIFPQLQQQWPGLESTLFRASQLQSEALDILEEVAEHDLTRCELDLEVERKNNRWFLEPMLDRQKLQTLSAQRIKNCMQYWLRKNNVAVLKSTLLKQVVDEFIIKQPGAKTQISWKYEALQFHLRHYQNRLFLSREPDTKTSSIKSNTSFLWDYKKDRKIDLGNIQLQVQFSEQQSIKKQTDKVQSNREGNRLALNKLPDTVRVKFRQGGERFRKNQYSQHFSLKKWFQEQSVPPWIRSRVPLIYVGEELIQAGYSIVNQEYKFQQDGAALSFNITTMPLFLGTNQSSTPKS